MTPFTRVESRAAVLDRANVDTDQIIPARFLRKPRGDGYHPYLFHDLRAAEPDFPLDQPAAVGAAILLAGDNFGCGSSREGAVYALVDAGIRCVIAPSFGDIFAGNAGKNGLLTVVLPAEEVAALMAQASSGGALIVDLADQRVQSPDQRVFAFRTDPRVRHCLLHGLDDIGLTMEAEPDIAAFEASDRAARPWAIPA